MTDLKLTDENFQDVIDLASFMIELIATRVYTLDESGVDWQAIYEEVQTSYTGNYNIEMAELAIELIEESAEKYQNKIAEEDEYYIPPGTTIH